MSMFVQFVFVCACHSCDVSQALTFHRHEQMNNGICRVNLEHQMSAGVEWLAPSIRPAKEATQAFFVSTCMGRYHQLRIAMLYNLCILWPFREQFKVCVMFWNDDCKDIDEFATEAAFFIDHGFLHIASAGMMGIRSGETRPCPARVPGFA